MAQEYLAYNLINHLYYPDNINNGENAEKEILKKYITEDQDRLKNAVNVPDIITNINGNHEYKLISGKDIDFENMFLENSAITGDGWNNFPENRRWANGTSLRINEMYELMNVIDYLLCATNNLFNEINKLKYNEDSENVIWFVSNAISNSPGYYLQDHLKAKDFINGNIYGLKTTYLNPSEYSSPINAKNEDGSSYSFGISTIFHDDHINDYKFTRILKNKYSNKRIYGVEANINEQGNIEYSSQTKYISDIIYGYLIGTDLHLYPGLNIVNFLIDDIDFCTDIKNFVDVTNKCLYNTTYFKFNKTVFKKVYAEFLGNKSEGLIGPGSRYILYILDSNVKKIIYYSDNLDLDYLNNNVINNKTYKMFDYSGTTGIINQYITDTNTNKITPYLYRIKNSNVIELSVMTPKTANYDSKTATIEIEYFKNNNNISVKVYNNETNKEISLSEEYLQENVVIYNPERYNIPEKTDILLDIKANVLNKTNTNYKTDDEYLDFPYYWDNDNINTISDYDYYQYNGIDNESGVQKRKFKKFENVEEFRNFLMINRYDDPDITFTQVYKKIENPYDITYTTTVSELLTQTCDYDRLAEIINNIKNNNIIKDTNNNILINYELPDDLEQIKFDLDLLIEETGKTKEGYYKVPLNINRIHNLSINFNSPQLYTEEANKYQHIKYNVVDTPAVGTLSPIHRSSAEEWKTNGLNPHYGQYLTASDLYKEYSGELTSINTNMNILSFMNSDFSSSESFNQTDIDNNTCYLDQRSYDNTLNNGRTLYITYNTEHYYVNLIGGKKLNNNLITKIGNATVKHFALSYVMSGNTKIDLNLQANLANTENYGQIFAVHGLGMNYYCHGADSYAWFYRAGSPPKYSFYHAQNSHNLLTVCDLNESSNINKFLGFAVEQNDSNGNDIIKDYVSYIYVGNNNNKQYYKTNGKVKYNGEFITAYDSIYTDCIRINKRNFSYTMIKEEFIDSLQNNIITYYIQTSYLQVLNSTFYPKPNSYPPLKYDNENNLIGAYYDLNIDEDINKYIEYKNSFGSDTTGEENSYYRPITLSLKFEENLDNGIPFFNESNIAKLKMNIVREINNNTAPRCLGIDRVSYVSPGIQYYLSDFTDMNIKRVGDDKDLKTYTGSYLYLDLNNYNTNNIITFKEALFEKNHEYGEINGVSAMILTNNFDLGQFTVPYPIPAKYKNESNDVNNLYYFYDITRIAELNKMKLNNYRIYNEINSTGYTSTSLDNPGSLDIDFELLLLKIAAENDKLFTNNNNMDQGFYISLDPIAHYGSRNYHSNTSLSTSEGARIFINYIYRLHDDSVIQTNLYPILIYGDKKFDIFKYSYDFDHIIIKTVVDDEDVYSILDNIFESDKIRYGSDNAFNNNTKDDNIYRYYRTQVEAFMNYSIFTDNDLLNHFNEENMPPIEGYEEENN